MRVRVLLMAGTLTALTVACSVVDDGRVTGVDPPFGLDDTLPPSTTVEITTTEAVTTTTGLESTTTDVQAETVRLYYIASGRLNFVPSRLPPEFALSQLIDALKDGKPEGDLGRGLRSAIPLDAEITVTTDGLGVAQVVLPEGFFDTIPAGDQRLVIAQLVLTLLDNSRGIGQVTFNQQVSGPDGELIAAGELLTRLDYQGLLASATPSATTTPSTTGSTAATAATSVP